MNLRLRAAVWLAGVAVAVDEFPDSLIRAAKKVPGDLAVRIRRVSRSLCGCRHHTAKGCSLYQKDTVGPCKCPCHAHESAPKVTTYTFRTNAGPVTEMSAAFRRGDRSNHDGSAWS